MQEGLKNNKKDIILKNFVEFLEVTGITEFTGIPFAYNNGAPEESYSEEKAKEILLKIKKELQDKCEDLKFDKKQEINWTKIYEKEEWNRIKKQTGKAPTAEITHYSIYVFPEYFGIDIFLKVIKKNYEKINDIIDKLDIIANKINLNEDQTWLLQFEKWKGYRARKDETKEYFNARDKKGYAMLNFVFHLQNRQKMI